MSLSFTGIMMKNALPQSAALSVDVTLGEKMTAFCPSCGHHTTFTFVGVQVWPDRVAAALNVSPKTNLWHCGNCETTLSGNAFEE
jgi:ribosomal protein L37AE/L43A